MQPDATAACLATNGHTICTGTTAVGDVAGRRLLPLLATQPCGQLSSSDATEVPDGHKRPTLRVDLAPGGGKTEAEQVHPFQAGPPVLRQVAVATAILRRADPELAGPLVGVPPRLAAAHLAVLRQLGVLADAEDCPMSAQVEAEVLAALDGAELRRLRARAARLLNETGAPARTIAEQLVRLDDLDEPWMLDVLSEAATDAGRHSAAEEVRLRTRLLRARPSSPAVEIDLAAALLDVDPSAAAVHVWQALPRADDPRTRARAAVCLGLVALATGSGPAAPRLLREATQMLTSAAGVAPRLQDRALLAAVGSTQAAAAVVGVAPYAVRLEVDDVPAPVGAASTRRMLAARALAAAYRGAAPETAARYARLAIEHPAQGEAWPALMAARVLFLTGDHGGALAVAERQAGYHRERGEWYAEASARAGLAHLLLQVGELGPAHREATAALEAVGPVDAGIVTWAATATTAAVLAAQGQMLAAKSLLDRVWDRVAVMPVWERVQTLTVAATAAYGLRNSDQALRLIQACGRVLDEAGVRCPALSCWWLDEIVLLARRCRRREAHARLEQVEERCRDWSTARTRGLALLARAVLADTRRQVELAQAALGELTTAPAPPYQAMAQLVLGRALATLGDRAAARRHLREAMVLCTRLGYHALAAHCRTVLGAAGGRAGSQSSECGGLSTSELAVARLAAGGATNRQIAAELSVSVRTVEFHLTNAYRRLGIRRRAALAGMVEPMALSGSNGRRAAGP